MTLGVVYTLFALLFFAAVVMAFASPKTTVFNIVTLTILFNAILIPNWSMIVVPILSAFAGSHVTPGNFQALSIWIYPWFAMTPLVVYLLLEIMSVSWGME